MAVISWYGMLRNGIQLVYNDIKDAESYSLDVKDMVDDLGRQERQLEQWQRRWWVWEETPQELYEKFWGPVEYKTIQTKLNMMKACASAASEALADFTNSPEEIPNVNSKWTLSKAKFWRSKAFLKLKFISTKKKFVQDILEKMEKLLAKLDNAAKAGWHRDSAHAKNDVDYAEVRRTAIGFLLVPIAMESHKYTEVIWTSWNNARETLTAELDLDIFGASLIESRDRYSQAMAKAAAEKQATLTILTRNTPLQVAEMRRLLFKHCAMQSTLPVQDQVDLLADAVTRLINGANECHFKAEANLSFLVSKSNAHVYGQGTGIRQSLLQIQSTNTSPYSTRVALLGTISKFRIAFELSQACLLFLRTTWFSKICSCGIQCGSPPNACNELQYDFTFRFGVVEHESSQLGGTQRPCWGQSQDNHNWNSLMVPIRRVGLLLVEATLGMPVIAIRCDGHGAIASMTFLGERRGAIINESLDLDSVMDSVREAAHKSLDYMNAVKHCVTVIFPHPRDDDEVRERLAEFYSVVVVPTKDMYDDLLDRHLDRQRQINAARGRP